MTVLSTAFGGVNLIITTFRLPYQDYDCTFILLFVDQNGRRFE